MGLCLVCLQITFAHFFRKLKKEALSFTLSILVAGAFIELVKMIVERVRPLNALVQEANSGIQQDNQQTSARRDPLVTAGVVGNLDRNKIGHTGMGPNKYNHLYGG